MMRRTLFAAALFAACCSVAFADGATVTIQNEEGATFYYTVDPPDLAQLSPGSPHAATRVAEFFAERSQDPRFTALAPGAQASLQGLSNGPHLLVGFFALENQDTFPVRVITLQADSGMGERYYAVYGSPALVEATPGLGRLAQFARPAPGPAQTPASQTAASQPGASQTAGSQPAAPQAEAAPAAATAITAGGTPPAATAPTPIAVPAPTAAEAPAGPKPLISLPPAYQPVAFTREAQDGFSVQPIAGARSWKRPGTRISAVDARIDKGILRLSLTTEDGFSPDVSYYIYAFADRTPRASAIFTLELRPRALPNRGACLLWQPQAGGQTGPASGTPSIFGSVTVEGKTATLVADLRNAPASASQATSFDLTSCRFDAATGVYEEFFFATVALADVPVTR